VTDILSISAVVALEPAEVRDRMDARWMAVLLIPGDSGAH
jgi:hypothetical protein